MGTGNGTGRVYWAQDGRFSRDFRDAHLSSTARYPLVHLFHPRGAGKYVRADVRGHLARNNLELIVDHRAPGNGPTHGDKMRSPLKNETKVPADEASKNRGREHKGVAR